jgi:hypothetical protein
MASRPPGGDQFEAFSQRGFQSNSSGPLEAFLRRFLSPPGITTDAFAAYLRALREPGTAHGMCEDCRPGASIDELHESGGLLGDEVEDGAVA